MAAEVLQRSTCNLLVVPPEAGLRSGGTTAEAAAAELRTGADWDFVSDEIPAAAGKA